MSKERLDVLLVKRGLCDTRAKAQALIVAGKVKVSGETVTKPGKKVPVDAKIVLTEGPKYVSRGGIKLEHALKAFGVDPSGMVAADIGASTGGFTDCLLKKGAKKVYAVDVGYGLLDWRLRNDRRVVVLEKTNARYLTRKHVPEPIDIATVDLSFISTLKVLPAIGPLLKEGGLVVWLVKPQFEAGKGKVPRGGVIKDPRLHLEVLTGCSEGASALGFEVLDVTFSPITGADGNIEFFLLLKKACVGQATLSERKLAQAVEEAWAKLKGKDITL